MRTVLALSVIALAAVLAVSGAATAGPNGNGPKRDGNHGHWYKRACAIPAAGVAACDAQVVTDSTGKLLASAATPSGMTPAQFHGAYSLPTTSVSGTPTIGIVDAFNDPTIEADLATYSSQYRLPSCTTANGCFRKVNQTGGTSYPANNAGWSLEIALDVQTAHAICQNCHILLVEATTNSTTNLGIAENEAVSLGATVVSNSWGGSEGSSETNQDSAYFNHPGVPITFSSGDGGYGVEYPAASPNVTAVGGTTLNVSGTTWVSESAWSGAGSGCSAFESKPSWQHDSGCSRRTVADVSADADPNTGAAVYDSNNGGWVQVGGTSLASPLIASVYALTGTTTSVVRGSTPYAHTSSLHDVASGSNGNCGGSYLCTAVGGYDGPSGLGTPNGLGGFTVGNPTADFTVGVSPSTKTVAPGTSATYTVTVGALNGFSTSVGLSQTGLANGTFTPPAVTGSGSSTLSVDTTSISPGTYPFTITGTSGGTTHSVSATLVVQPVATGDFTISVSPASATIGRNSTTTYDVTIGSVNSFAGSVALSATGFASGATGSFSPNPTSPGKSTLTVTAFGLRRHLHFTVTITGTSGSLSHSTTLRLST